MSDEQDILFSLSCFAPLRVVDGSKKPSNPVVDDNRLSSGIQIDEDVSEQQSMPQGEDDQSHTDLEAMLGYAYPVPSQKKRKKTTGEEIETRKSKRNPDQGKTRKYSLQRVQLHTKRYNRLPFTLSFYSVQVSC
jgi:hypothetical protein